jgi:hypothetical protein
MMDIFHVLPLAAVLILFVLLATDGQFREIYISYLEGPQNGVISWIAGILTAMVALGLISAVLYEAHYALSTMRINVIYSSYSNPDANSRMRRLQRAAAFVLAFLPWLGLTVGLFGARNFVANRYCQLLNVAGVAPDELHRMQYLPLPGGWTIAGAVLVLGVATAYFSSAGEQNRIAQRAVACCAPLLVVLLFLLFTDWLDTNKWSWRSTATCVAIAVVTVIYYLIYQWLYRRRRGFVFSPAQSGTGISLRKRRRRWLAVWAFLPWFFLAGYFACIQYIAPMAQFAEDWSDCPLTAASVPVPGHWAIFPVAMCGTIAFGLLVGHLLGRFSTSKWRLVTILVLVAVLAGAVETLSFFGTINLAVSVYRFIGPLGTASLELLFLISTFAGLAALSQRSGFPALTLVLLTMVVCAMFPNYAGWTAAALGIVYLLFAAMAFLSGRVAVGIVALLLPVIVWVNWHNLSEDRPIGQNPAAAKPDLAAVKAQFACWLGQRGISVSPPPPGQKPVDCSSYGKPPISSSDNAASTNDYPVLIVAAEGGGIYAASAASMFLAKLQDAAPHFAEHVFALSGVSGGAIGVAIFQALDHAAHPDPTATTGTVAAAEPIPCVRVPASDRQNSAPPLAPKVAGIMQDDHFSPVVGSIFPEIFGAPLTRPDALVASFEYSAFAQDVAAGRNLCAPFEQHWSPVSVAPALVLNSTWVEMGFRVAFAPFHLHGTDESLYSFSDESMPALRDKKCSGPADKNQPPCVSVMSAAAVSARFPLILPPFSVVMNAQTSNAKGEKASARKRWNFVDGAYSDNSGATTALDIYRAIQDVSPHVQLRIILITSSNPQPNLTNQSINGTAFRDTLAPIDAVMKVREDLGNDAVARACTYVYEEQPKNQTNPDAPPQARTSSYSAEVNEPCIDHSGYKTSPLQMIEIQDQTYGLALGWKISKTSFEIVSWMLGAPGDCHRLDLRPSKDSPSPGDDDTLDGAPAGQSDLAHLTKAIVERNSCVLRSIVELIGDPIASATPAPSGAAQ